MKNELYLANPTELTMKFVIIPSTWYNPEDGVYIASNCVYSITFYNCIFKIKESWGERCCILALLYNYY